MYKTILVLFCTLCLLLMSTMAQTQTDPAPEKSILRFGGEAYWVFESTPKDRAALCKKLWPNDTEACTQKSEEIHSNKTVGGYCKQQGVCIPVNESVREQSTGGTAEQPSKPSPDNSREQEVAELRAVLVAAESAKREAEETSKALQQRLATRVQEFKKLATRVRELEEALATTATNLKARDKQTDRLKRDLAFAQENLSTLQQDKAELEGTLTNARTVKSDEVTALGRQLAELREQLSTKATEVGALEARLVQDQAVATRLRSLLEERKVRLAEITHERNELQKKLTKLQEEHGRIAAIAAEQVDQIQQLEYRVKGGNTRIEELAGEIGLLRQAKEAAESALAEKKREGETAAKNSKRLREWLTTEIRRGKNAEARITVLVAEMDEFRETNQSVSNVQDKIDHLEWRESVLWFFSLALVLIIIMIMLVWGLMVRLPSASTMLTLVLGWMKRLLFHHPRQPPPTNSVKQSRRDRILRVLFGSPKYSRTKSAESQQRPLQNVLDLNWAERENKVYRDLELRRDTFLISEEYFQSEQPIPAKQRRVPLVPKEGGYIPFHKPGECTPKYQCEILDAILNDPAWKQAAEYITKAKLPVRPALAVVKVS